MTEFARRSRAYKEIDVNILVPVAGATPFFPADEFPFPKPLIEIADRPMIARAIENLQELEGDNRFIFVTMQDDAAKYSYDRVLRLHAGDDAVVVKLSSRASGALCSCLMAIEHIDPDKPLIIANYDQIVSGELGDLISRFEEMQADCGVLTFNATHPRWSYVKTEGLAVVEAAEKRVISRQAIAGLYWFAKGSDFILAAMNSIRVNDSLDGEFYVAPILNQLILMHRHVVALPMRPGSKINSFFLPARITAYEQELKKEAARGAATPEQPGMRVNVVIPAAGAGSRFAKVGYSAPKPFIDVLGKAMIARVIDNVAVRDARFTLLLRREHLSDYAESAIGKAGADMTIVPVEQLTEGTACTLLLARKHFDTDEPLLVANSDQLVDFDCQDFVDDARRRGLDGSILVFRDKERNPKWSFAALDEQGFVTEVAEKKPISDLATVGIYLFMNGSRFVRSAIDMIANNDRVNNEFYTCPVYNYMIRDGARIGVYEVDPSAMSGLGTPEDLDIYLRREGGEDARSRHAPA